MQFPILILLFSFYALADFWDPILAHREPGISYNTYVQRAREASDLTEEEFLASALNSARYYKGESALPQTTKWDSYQEVVERFERIRDTRFLRTSTNFPRRSSWLYPDDGCFARAALANRNLHNWGHPAPGKAFVFGNLRVKTKNSKSGYVYWWYHVVPVVQVGSTKYVLDPAIHAHAPLKFEDWLSRMGKPSQLKVAICSSGTYGPSSSCARRTYGVESSAMSAQTKYLDLEWNRLKSLGRNPNRELGSSPPWL